MSDNHSDNIELTSLEFSSRRAVKCVTGLPIEKNDGIDLFILDPQIEYALYAKSQFPASNMNGHDELCIYASFKANASKKKNKSRKHLPIQVKVSYSVLGDQNTMSKIVAESSTILGVPENQTVLFNDNGLSVYCKEVGLVPFKINNAEISALPVGKYRVAWKWEYSVYIGNNSFSDRTNHMLTTIIDVYVIYDKPNFPWTYNTVFGNKGIVGKFPSVSVLNKAIEWIKSCDSQRQTVPDEKYKAASNIVKNLFKTGFKYNGGTSYCKNSNEEYSSADVQAYNNALEKDKISPNRYFQVSQLLNDLNLSNGLGFSVNCEDCAHIVITFANILGCNLMPGKLLGIPVKNMHPAHDLGLANFNTNPVKLIGGDQFETTNFDFHTVAWTIHPNSIENGEPICPEDFIENKNVIVFDGCLKLFNPLGAFFDPIVDGFLAQGMYMYNTDDFLGYRRLLAIDGVEGIDRCIPQPDSVVRLRIT